MSMSAMPDIALPLMSMTAWDPVKSTLMIALLPIALGGFVAMMTMLSKERCAVTAGPHPRIPRSDRFPHGIVAAGFVNQVLRILGYLSHPGIQLLWRGDHDN